MMTLQDLTRVKELQEENRLLRKEIWRLRFELAQKNEVMKRMSKDLESIRDGIRVT